MQENRNAGNIDRVKLNSTEGTLDDVKDSGNPVNDSTIVISVYYPIKYQLRTYRDYRVVDDKTTGELGLGSALRSLILLKNRLRIAQSISHTFFMTARHLLLAIHITALCSVVSSKMLSRATGP